MHLEHYISTNTLVHLVVVLRPSVSSVNQISGVSWLVCKNPDFNLHLGKRVKILIWNSDSK